MIKIDRNMEGYDQLCVGNTNLTLAHMLVVLCELLHVVFCVNNEMGGACGAYGGGERCAQVSGGET